MPRRFVPALLACGALLITSCSGGQGHLAIDDPTTGSVPPSTSAPTPTSPPTAADSSSATTLPTVTTAAGDPRAAISLDELHSPTSASAAARALTRIERGLRSTNRDAARLAHLGRDQQLAYRALSKHPSWVVPVIAKIPEAIRAPVQANADAGAALSSLTGSTPTTLPDWTILVPKPADTLRGYYTEAEQASGVSWTYLAAIHLVETRMGRIHGNSSAGAQGPMQFIPTTWSEYGQGGDINSDHDAILAAGRFLAANGGVSDIDHALFRYNNSSEYVAAVKAYAGVMLSDPRAYDGYHGWRVFYATASGAFLLPEGYRAT